MMGAGQFLPRDVVVRIHRGDEQRHQGFVQPQLLDSRSSRCRRLGHRHPFFQALLSANALVVEDDAQK